MPDIRQQILDAEAATPHVEYSATVIKPPPAPVDANAENLRVIWRILSGTRRAKLEQDYKIWQATLEHLEAIKSIVAQFPEKSPLKKRLSYTPRPPSMWSICSTCNGSGDGDIGYCRICGGDGYVA